MTITGRGTVRDGRIEQGVVKVGDDVEVVGLRPTQKTVCTGVEMFHKLLDQGQAGDNVRPAAPWHEEGGRGARPGCLQARARSRLTPTSRPTSTCSPRRREGGTSRFFSNYRPQSTSARRM